MKEYPVNPQILLLHNKYNDSLVICYEWCWSTDNISDKKNKTFSSDHIKKCPLRFNDFWVKNMFKQLVLQYITLYTLTLNLKINRDRLMSWPTWLLQEEFLTQFLYSISLPINIYLECLGVGKSIILKDMEGLMPYCSHPMSPTGQSELSQASQTGLGSTSLLVILL